MRERYSSDGPAGVHARGDRRAASPTLQRHAAEQRLERLRPLRASRPRGRARSASSSRPGRPARRAARRSRRARRARSPARRARRRRCAAGQLSRYCTPAARRHEHPRAGHADARHDPAALVRRAARPARTRPRRRARRRARRANGLIRSLRNQTPESSAPASMKTSPPPAATEVTSTSLAAMPDARAELAVRRLRRSPTARRAMNWPPLARAISCSTSRLAPAPGSAR